MIKLLLLIFAVTRPAWSSPKDVRLFFPQDKQYVYEVHASLTTGTGPGPDESSTWTIMGRLKGQVLNDSQVRFELDDIKVHVSSKNDGHISYQFDEDAKLLKLPWIVEYYKDSCLIESIYLASEPVWVSNIKRALSLNFQLKKGEGVYTVYEPCIQDYRCLITYMANGTSLKKYTSSPSSPKYGNSWISVPWTDPIYRQDQIVWNSLPDTTTVTTQREYKLNDNDDGISSIQLEEHISYKIGDQNLQIFTDVLFPVASEAIASKPGVRLDHDPGIEININYETELQGVKADWPKLTRASVKYDRESCVDSLCGIKTHSQGFLKNKTFEILLKISKKGIDADNIVRNPAMIHSLDFIHLLHTMSQLNYTTLRFLFDDLVLGTSYELETSRNIFLEVLPYAGSIASVKFIKHLVIEEKEKIEDSALLALIRKLPFTGANYTQELLQELEAFTKLGLDFPQEIRHAAILSFATLLHQTKREGKVGDDDFDNMVVKYVRMYSDCVHYMDRLIWLQGLCNIGFWAQKYTMEIFTDTSKKRNERLWAAFSTNYVDNQYYTDGQVRMIDLLLPTLANQTEDVQIKMAALHVFLTSTTITQNDFLLVSRYIEGNPRLERFWCMAVNSLKTYRNFDGYKLAAMYVPSHDCPFAPSLWTTNNLIITSEDQASSVHFLSTADDMDLPNFAGLRLTVSGRRVSVYIVAEGISLNIYKRMHRFSEADLKVDKLVELLQEFKAYAVKPGEEVHVDLVVKVQEKAVFIGHMNQTRFDSWNILELAMSVNDFLRLGSHINQQLVYYPSHNELIFPNELGIPVKLQTTKLSFTSIRGNLTTPSTDLHIRYQGVTLTSLSTFGALVQSEHSARVQSSTVAHLPIRFNATAAAGGVVNFISPNLQRGGIVMHTRTQVEKNANGSTDSYYISRNPGGEEYEVNESSIYFDCDHSAAGLELEDLFTTSFYDVLFPVASKAIASKPGVRLDHDPGIDFLNSLRPSRLFLNSIPVLISSPSKACGVIYPPKTLGEDNGLLATLTMDDAPSVAGFMSGKQKELSVALVFKYYRQYAESPEDDTIFKFDADFSISHVDEKVITRLVVNGSRPNTSAGDWKLFLENEDYYVNSKNSYFLGLEYLGNLDIVYTAKDVSRILKVGYKTPEDRGGVRGKRIDYHVMNENLPQELLTHLGLGCESETYRRNPLFSTSAEKAEFNASLKVEDTTASVSVNNDSETKFVSLGFNWLFETFTNLKTMANYGLYRACGFNKSSPENMTLLTAPYDFYYRPRSGPVECLERVLLADCTAVPRFAVIHQMDGGLKIYAGGYYVDVNRVGGRISFNETQSGGHLRVFPFQDGVKITSKLSAVEIIYKQESVSILVPNSHLHAVCGECVGEEYKKCPETK